DDGYIMARNNLGVLLQKSGRLNESRAVFESALDIDYNNSLVLLNYANVLSEIGANGDAEASYRRVIGIDPGYKEAYRNFAQFLYNNGRYAEAKDMMEKAG
ncbi:MAG: tetratricopeptide repeat protein, partial [Candidatus Aenigmarchaeota archaeon]|nr:tetratricopeptide repeat protein [Candidatus Aenigmarchaeota archaeon]